MPMPQREIVDFPPNVPVVVSLKFAQGKLIANQRGERMMYTTADDRVIFLDVPVAGQITQLGITVRENFTITKRTDGKKDSRVSWDIARTMGEQPNGTFVVPAVPTPSPAVQPASPKPMASAAAATPNGARSALVTEADSLVDAYAQVLARALTTYEGRIKPDEVRALLISAYIQRRQLSSVAS